MKDENNIIVPDEVAGTSAAEEVATGDDSGLPSVPAVLSTILEEDLEEVDEEKVQAEVSAADEVAMGDDIMSDPFPPPGYILYHTVRVYIF